MSQLDGRLYSDILEEFGFQVGGEVGNQISFTLKKPGLSKRYVVNFPKGVDLLEVMGCVKEAAIRSIKREFL